MEMEVWKLKYRSEKKSRLSVFSVLLTHKLMCVLRPCGKKVTQSL